MHITRFLKQSRHLVSTGAPKQVTEKIKDGIESESLGFILSIMHTLLAFFTTPHEHKDLNYYSSSLIIIEQLESSGLIKIHSCCNLERRQQEE